MHWHVLTAALIVVAAWVAFVVARIVWAEAHGLSNADSQLYWTVGRGMANGLKPYVDLYENKPPGIFLLSALSIYFTNGHALASIVQGAIFGLLPLIVFVTAIRRTAAVHMHRRVALCLCAFILAGLLSLSLERNSGHYQTESFGAFFIVLYACSILWDGGKMGFWPTVFASIGLGGGIGFKEPFLVVGLGLALLLSHSPKDLWRTFIRPLIFAAIAGATILFFLGYLDGYLNMYLLDTMERVRPRASFADKVMTFMAFGRTVNGFADDWTTTAILFLVSATMAFIFLQHDSLERKLHRIGLMWIGIALAVFTIHISRVYWPHHKSFAAPLYFALVLFFVIEFARSHRRIISGVVIVILCTVTMIGGWTREPAPLPKERPLSDIQREVARFDAALTACNIDRYLYIGGQLGKHPYGRTEHSPMGPAFEQTPRLVKLLRFMEPHVENLENTDIIVYIRATRSDMVPPAAVRAYISQYFTTKPYACMGKGVDFTRHTIYYRKKRGSTAPFVGAVLQEDSSADETDD